MKNLKCPAPYDTALNLWNEYKTVSTADEVNFLVCNVASFTAYLIVISLIIRRGKFGKFPSRIKAGLIVFTIYLPYKLILTSMIFAQDNYAYFVFQPKWRLAFIAGQVVWIGLHWSFMAHFLEKAIMFRQAFSINWDKKV